MKFNLCLVQPDGYIHSAAFTELAELVYFALQDLGHEPFLSINKTYVDARNIIIGSHLLNVSEIKNVDKSTIVLNTEQLGGVEEHHRGNILQWVSNFETWDYSRKNLELLSSLGVTNTKLLKIGYQKELSRISKADHQDIDVLFYGSTNDRRLKILNELSMAGLNVVIKFGVYGKERDDLIVRSKVVLNHHYYDSKIFEIVRVFYLMTNRKAVAGEVSEDTFVDEMYLNGFYRSTYDQLVSSCIELVNNQTLRERTEASAFEVISALPQHEYLRDLLS